MKIVHLTDLHYSKKNSKDCLYALNHVVEMVDDPDLYIMTGDLFDAGIQNSDRDAFPELLDAIQDLTEIAPIVAITGTPSHDVPGCYAALQEIGGFFLKGNRAEPYWFVPGEVGVVGFYGESDPDPEALMILGMGEPGKAWFLRDKTGLGKEQSDTAVNEGLKAMLLGMAAKRREYPDNPCLFAYHGMVRGARLNEHAQSTPKGQLEIGVDDLAAIGANYYALGHIHLAQSLPGLPEAKYGGSAYPITWGELDQKKVNVITIDGPNSTVIDYIDMPFMPRKKIDTLVSVDPVTGAVVFDEEISGAETDEFDVWLNMHVPATISDRVDPLVVGQAFCDDGVNLSRVTKQIIPVETTRNTLIRAMKSLREKVISWGISSDIKTPETLLVKADEIEVEMMKSGDARTDGAVIRIDKLILTGAIGTWKNGKRDQVTVDFTDLDEGVVALLGDNGAGKSTVLENLHPYPQLLTRTGKLQDHFRLQNSCRDLYFTNERTGDKYRAQILINGKAKTGGCEYFLYKNGSPLVSGRLEEYSTKIEELFGPIRLYLRSAFVMQKPNKNVPEISDATAGDKKALFSALAGIDYFQNYAAFAGESKKIWADRQQETRMSKMQIEDRLSKMPELALEKERLTKIVNSADLIVSARETELTDRNVEIDKLVEEETVRKNRDTRRFSLNSQRDSLESEAKSLREGIALDQELTEKLPEMKRQARQYDEFSEKFQALQSEEISYANSQADIRASHDDATGVVREEDRELEQKAAAVLSEISELTVKETGVKGKVIHAEELLDHKATCPKCDHVFSIAGQEKAEELIGLRRDLKDTRELIAARRIVLTEYQDKRTSLEWPKDPELTAWPKRAEKNGIEDLMKNISVDMLRRNIESASNAETRIGEANNRLNVIGQDVMQIVKELTEIPALPARDAQLTEMKRLRNIAQQELDRHRKDRAEAAGARQKIQESLTEMASDQEEIVEISEKLNREGNESEEWGLLEAACGRNGIQALELDAVAPTITQCANDFLTAAYGPRYTIEIRTQKVSGSGAKTKMIEAFDIIVHDAENNMEQPYDTLSGGEAVWVKKAIYDAFGAIRAENTGLSFNTVFLDEADGALHPDAREQYLQLVRAAHRQAGRAHTVIVTHSKELQQMIGEKIEL